MFKNPADDQAGRLIDVAGCKGMQSGGAKISEKHANFIINQGNATAWEAIQLIDQVREQVLKRTGITLELEVRIMKSSVR